MLNGLSDQIVEFMERYNIKRVSNLNGSLSKLIAIKVFMFYSGAIWLEVN